MVRFVVALAGFAGCLWASADRPLDTLRRTHPRLIALDSDIERIRGLLRGDETARHIYEQLKQSAARIENEPPVEYQLIGPRLLDKSRRCLDRVYTLALLYRLGGERRYLDRALKELRAAAAFPDWHPAHFLDTAEMTHAFAIGYDWLYPALSEADRALLRRAILDKGIAAALPIYEKNTWWAKVEHNWNQVCNGGIALGALAVADEEPGVAAYVLRRSMESIRLAMHSYAPDGGWAEGPGYWDYATRYNVYYLAGLETALGTDFGLSRLPGFSQAGDFRVYFQGPAGDTFNYADAHPAAGAAPEMFWLARRFALPVYAWDETRKLQRASALDLVWYQPHAESPQQAHWPLDRVFSGVDVAFLRADWEDPKAFWVAVKGGDNKANHSHLDLGSFVMDALGVRWAVDLGADDYNMPGYFGQQRYTYYRLRTESHNTVLIDGENQDAAAQARILPQQDGPDVRIDLTAAYPAKLARFIREVKREDRDCMLFRDEIEAKQPVEALWGMVTQAEVRLDGRRAALVQDGRNLRAEVLSPEGARFDTISAAAPPPQAPNPGAKKLVIRLPGKIEKTTISVRFTAN